MRALPSSIKDVFALPFSDSVNARALAANTAESMTVPAGANYVAFSATGDFYVNVGTTATVPGDVTDGAGSELNPTIRALNGAGTISIIAPATCVVTAAFYS